MLDGQSSRHSTRASCDPGALSSLYSLSSPFSFPSLFYCVYSRSAQSPDVRPHLDGFRSMQLSTAVFIIWRSPSTPVTHHRIHIRSSLTLIPSDRTSLCYTFPSLTLLFFFQFTSALGFSYWINYTDIRTFPSISCPNRSAYTFGP